MPGLALLDRRLLVVTGKGGVGKSTLAASVALVAARRGRRVLVCEVNAQERIAPLLGAPPSGSEIREVLPGLFTLDVTPQEAMRQYGLMVLKFRSVYDMVFENRLVRYALRAIPSLSELVMLGKILHEVRREVAGRRAWDLVIIDAPATGHAVQLLRVPGALLESVPPGPLRSDVAWMQELLLDPATTASLLVTLPEELPVSEAITLDTALREVVGLPRGALILNAMPEERFTPDEHAQLAPLAAAPPLGPAVAAARLQIARAALAHAEGARVRSALDIPVLEIPALPRARWDRRAIEAIADHLAGSL